MRRTGKWNKQMACAAAMLLAGVSGALCSGCDGGGGGGGPITWEATFGEAGYDQARSVQQTADGGYIAAGSTDSFGAGGYDMYLVKTGGSGNLLWERTFGGTDYDCAYSVQQTTDGGYIVAGVTDSFGASSYDMYLVKTDSDGNEVWYNTFGGPQDDEAYSVQQTADGGYILAGMTDSFGVGAGDVYLLKTDNQGNELWFKTFGGTGEDYANSVQQTADGGYIVAGLTGSFGAGSFDMYLVKTDSMGNLVWSKTFGGTGLDWARSVQQTADGGYILAGGTDSFGAGSSDMYLVKTDDLGNHLWEATFGGTENDVGHSVQQTDDGGYIAAGSVDSIGGAGGDMYLVKTDSDGNLVWQISFAGRGRDWAFSVEQTTDGGYIVAGETNSFGAGSFDMYLVKTDGLGNVY